jgi:hypothetical protein
LIGMTQRIKNGYAPGKAGHPVFGNAEKNRYSEVPGRPLDHSSGGATSAGPVKSKKSKYLGSSGSGES